VRIIPISKEKKPEENTGMDHIGIGERASYQEITQPVRIVERKMGNFMFITFCRGKIIQIKDSI
jgi:hypothetical protein